MAESNAFAEAPPTPELFVARVRRELDAVYADMDVPSGEIDRAAVDAVDELWDRPIKTFIPVLALRAAKERVAAKTTMPPAAEPRATPRAVTNRPPADRETLRFDPADDLVLADPEA
jgi:hypothetical protein